MYTDNKIICLCKNMNTFVVKHLKKIKKTKNNQIIEPLINKFISCHTCSIIRNKNLLVTKTE
jgi:hypothetical protein